MEKYKIMLTNLRESVVEKIKSLKEAEFKILPDEIDQIQEQESEELRYRMLTRESMYLKQIDSAIKLVELGRYGSCEDCGEEIGLARLKARPTASRCIDCQSDYEES